jgi:hypothetical protein
LVVNLTFVGASDIVFSVEKESVEVKSSIMKRMILRIGFSLQVMQMIDSMCFYLEREVGAW